MHALLGKHTIYPSCNVCHRKFVVIAGQETTSTMVSQTGPGFRMSPTWCGTTRCRIIPLLAQDWQSGKAKNRLHVGIIDLDIENLLDAAEMAWLVPVSERNRDSVEHLNAPRKFVPPVP